MQLQEVHYKREMFSNFCLPLGLPEPGVLPLWLPEPGVLPLGLPEPGAEAHCLWSSYPP